MLTALLFTVAGAALGFVIGVVPYFRAGSNLAAPDPFFIASIALAGALGCAFGIANGVRWYGKADAIPSQAQPRLLNYIKGKRLAPHCAVQYTIDVEQLAKQFPQAC